MAWLYHGLRLSFGSACVHPSLTLREPSHCSSSAIEGPCGVQGPSGSATSELVERARRSHGVRCPVPESWGRDCLAGRGTSQRAGAGVGRRNKLLH